MKNLTASRKIQVMRYHNWKTVQTHGFSWFVYDAGGKAVAMEISKAKAVHIAYEKFLVWQEQDRLAHIAVHVMNWQAGYIGMGIKL